MRNYLLGLFGAAIFLTIPSFVAAQYYGPTSTLVITAQTANGVSLPISNPTVSVIATGPSLTGTPTSSGVLNYSSNFGNDTKVVTMIPGTYAVSVPDTLGYTYTYSSGCSGYAVGGETKTCTITLSNYVSQSARLTVYTNVHPTYAPGYNPANFNVTVTGNSPWPSSFQGSSAGVSVTLLPGSYDVQGQSLIGWTMTRSADCNGNIQNGESHSCTLTYQYVYNYPYPYPYAGGLTCSPSRQSVPAGSTATFYAQGGAGTYTWTTIDRTYSNVGPVLNVLLPAFGSQNVSVTSGGQTATCTVVVTGGSYVSPSTGSGYAIPSVITYLPNTGFEPVRGASYAFAILLLIAASIFIYPHVRSTFRFFLR